MIYNFTYQTKNLINNKTYIGVHTTENLDDGYLGSGKRLQIAIKKYGVDNFISLPLEFFDTIEEAYEEEKWLVDENWILNENNYNIGLGGWGGDLGDVVNKSKSKTVSSHWKNGLYDIVDYSKAQKQSWKDNLPRRKKISKLLKKYYSVNDRYNKGISPSNETKKKLSNKTKLFWEEYNRKINVPILQFSENGIFIKEWDNINVVCSVLSIKKRTLYNTLNKENQLIGFIWKYKSINKN